MDDLTAIPPLVLPSLEERKRDIERFLAENPGIDLSSIRPRAYSGYMYLPGEECCFCRGDRDGARCLMSPECLFRYRAGLFTRQGGICSWCGEPLPADLNTVAYGHARMSTVSVDHIIPMTRGGPVRAEWNKQLVHGKCNTSKGNRVTAVALALAAEHDVQVLDFLAGCQHPGPMPPDTAVHLRAMPRPPRAPRTRERTGLSVRALHHGPDVGHRRTVSAGPAPAFGRGTRYALTARGIGAPP